MALIGFPQVEEADDWRLCARLEADNTFFENLCRNLCYPRMCVGLFRDWMMSPDAVNRQLFVRSLMRQLKIHFGSKKSSFG